MYELKTNTATRIAVGPLVDPTDGKTAETALTVTDLSVQLYQLKTDGTAVVRTQFTPTASSGNNDMVLVSSSTDGMYDLELTASQLNFLGNARICFYDVDAFLVHWIDIHVVTAAYFDFKFGSESSIPDAILKRDMSAVSGESARSPLNALRFLRNKWTLSGTTLSVKKEDDATEAWNATVSTTAGANPITGNDPA